MLQRRNQSKQVLAMFLVIPALICAWALVKGLAWLTEPTDPHVTVTDLKRVHRLVPSIPIRYIGDASRGDPSEGDLTVNQYVFLKTNCTSWLKSHPGECGAASIYFGYPYQLICTREADSQKINTYINPLLEQPAMSAGSDFPLTTSAWEWRVVKSPLCATERNVPVIFTPIEFVYDTVTSAYGVQKTQSMTIEGSVSQCLQRLAVLTVDGVSPCGDWTDHPSIPVQE